jgi:murein DD-endopeptidase MepM/ murein hydrolase activator NlpD
MAKTQFPIDGKLGKQYKVTSEYGWRIHPVEKTKKHHNGVDLWGAAATIYIENFHDGKVIFAGPSSKKNPDGSVGGFGYHVMVQHKIDGKFYVSVYAHMRKGSLKVKVGQKIEAGTVLGIMDATGMVTGKHLHWEINVGKKYVWTGNGKGYVNPMTFTKALIAKEAALAEAAVATPEDGAVAPAPTHDDAQADALAAERQAAKAAVA